MTTRSVLLQGRGFTHLIQNQFSSSTIRAEKFETDQGSVSGGNLHCMLISLSPTPPCVSLLITTLVYAVVCLCYCSPGEVAGKTAKRESQRIM